MKFFGTVLAAALIPTFGMAAAVPVDLSGWIENGYQGSNTAGNWTVQPGNDSVIQSINTPAPTVFFDPGSNAQGTALSGTIQVQTFSDDDLVGFVLGYQEDEFDSTSADFWLLDWKQNNQSPAVVGMSLSHVTGNIQAGSGDAFSTGFWNHDVGFVDEVQRATNLGSTGWADNQEYTFVIEFTSTRIRVEVDGVEEINYTGSFTDGAFGFYNFSQENVRYAGITTADVPLPAALPLLLAAVGGLGVVGRKRKAA